jgi:hypothetical protein
MHLASADRDLVAPGPFETEEVALAYRRHPVDENDELAPDLVPDDVDHVALRTTDVELEMHVAPMHGTHRHLRTEIAGEPPHKGARTKRSKGPDPSNRVPGADRFRSGAAHTGLVHHQER